MALTRYMQQADTIYVLPSGEAFYTPDGEGRIYYDSPEDAEDETGCTHWVWLSHFPEDY